MTKTIDKEKLKAAAEHLEWVLRQYPDEPVVRDLLESLLPLIEEAKAGRISEPVAGRDIPNAYNLSDGLYSSFKSPSVGGAYADFVTEMAGGLTELDRQIEARIDAAKKAARKQGGVS